MVELKEVWTGLLKWPAPAWRLLGYRKAPLGQRFFKLVRFKVTPVPTYHELREGTWEPDVINFIETHLRAGQTFVDVGAWIGLYSLLSSLLVGEKGKVYAFEPEPTSRRFLEKNLKANRANNVTVLPYALSSTGGNRLMDHKPGSSLARVYSNDECRLEDAVSVEVMTLDDFFRHHEVPDMIKIDVEGHENEVLKGGLEILRNPKTTVIIELHSILLRRFGVDPAEFIHQLELLRGRKAICLEPELSVSSMPTHMVFSADDRR